MSIRLMALSLHRTMQTVWMTSTPAIATSRFQRTSYDIPPFCGGVNYKTIKGGTGRTAPTRLMQPLTLSPN